MEKYYNEFDDTEENKFIYTDIFKQYVSQNASHFHNNILINFIYQTELVEGHLESELQARLPHFNMDKFMKSLE